jgi:hypothetical protein
MCAGARTPSARLLTLLDDPCVRGASPTAMLLGSPSRSISRSAMLLEIHSIRSSVLQSTQTSGKLREVWRPCEQTPGKSPDGCDNRVRTSRKSRDGRTQCLKASRKSRDGRTQCVDAPPRSWESQERCAQTAEPHARRRMLVCQRPVARPASRSSDGPASSRPGARYERNACLSEDDRPRDPRPWRR